MDNNNIITPHDRFFRSMMIDPKVIREFFEQNLPAHIRTVINFDSIAAEKDSFIDDHLRLQIADLLYSVEFGGQPGYLYILVEHQSTPDKLMPFRILQYIVAIMNHHLTKTGKSILPVVYPIIFYNGWKPYNCSTDIFDLFGEKKELAKDILWKPCQLINLSKIPDEEFKDRLFYGVVAYIMKHIYEKGFLPIFKNAINDIKSIESQCGVDYISTVLTYILKASEIDKQDFIDTVKIGLSTMSEEKVMTLAEQFKQEGRQEGLREGMTLAEQFKQEGRQEGWQDGKQEGKLEALKTVAMSLFSRGMPVAQIAAITGLSVQDIEQLKNKAAN